MHGGLHGNSLFYFYSIKLKLNWIDSKFPGWLLVLSPLIVWAAVHLHEAEPINVSLSNTQGWHSGLEGAGDHDRTLDAGHAGRRGP